MANNERAFDPELLRFLPALIGDFDALDMSKEELDEYLRSNYFGVGPRDGATYDDRTIPGLDDDPALDVRVFTPDDGSTPRGALIHIHGGGWSMGTIQDTFQFCFELAVGAGIVVVDVEYRLAPANPHPAALRDCKAALVWTAEHAAELGIDPQRIAVGGGSAGANLAAGLALWVRDAGGPHIAYQLLDIPSFDDRLTSPSMQEFVDTPVLTRDTTDACWRDHLGDLYGTDDVPYYAAPARCEDLSDLPPAYISVMEFDPLRDEAILHAMRLLQAGVSVELHNFAGTYHGSIGVASAISTRQREEMATVLRNRIGTG